VTVEHLEADEPDVGRNARKGIRARHLSAAANRARDVRSVTEVVVRRSRYTSSREVIKRLNAIFEIGRPFDTGIDDRDADAVAIKVGVISKRQRFR
jgi:hypothetical protein